MAAEKSFYNLEPAPVTASDPAPVQPAPAVVTPTPATIPAPAPAVVTQFTPAPLPAVPASGSFASRHPFLLALLAAAAVAIAFSFRPARDAAPAPGPDPAKASFGTLGHDYAVGVLIAGHADSLDQAASLVEKGEALKASFDKAHVAFESGRVDSWGKSIKPALARIVPIETPNANVTADQRTALVKALREVAKGERKASR